MSATKWIAALVLGALPLSALASPLVMYSDTRGQVTAIDRSFYELGSDQQVGAPIIVNFDFETNTSFATTGPGTWATQPASAFYYFGVTVAGTHLDFPSSDTSSDPSLFNQITLRDNVRNAAGDLVDVFELSARARLRNNTASYFLDTHLEFAADTFGDPDNWSILALEEAQLTGGTLHLLRVLDREEPPFTFSHLTANLSGFDVRFDGPGTEIPAVPEPGQFALLLAGLAGATVWRRRPAA